MNLTLTRRHLLYLLAFMTICLLLNFGADLLYTWLQGELAEPDAFSHELKEFGFFLLVNVVMLPAIIIVGTMIARGMLQPVRRITETAQAISEGRIAERIETPRTDDELGQLAIQLNQAFDRYKDVVDRQRRFTSNAAHQLRTPLASLRSSGEVALQQERSSTEYRDTIADMLEQTVGLSRLVEQMLELSRLGPENPNLPLASLDVGSVVAKVMDDYLPLAEEKEIALTRSLPASFPVRGNEVLLEQLVANLLDNAVRHTPEGGRIALTGAGNGVGTLRLTVADSGPGIPEDERDDVFQRFEQGVRPDAGGHGLGLSIVHEIVRLHGGEVRVEDSELGGAAFVVNLPAAREG